VLNFAHTTAGVLVPILALVALVVAAFFVYEKGWESNTGDYGRRYNNGSPTRHSYRTDAEYAKANTAYEVAQAVKAKAARKAKLVFGALVAVIVASLGLTVTYWVMSSYNIDRQYVTAVKVVNAPAPTFAQRAAYPVAVASAKTNMGAVTGDLDGVKFVATSTTDSWNALVERRATFGGYAAVQEQHIGLTGVSADPTICTFDAANADRKLGVLVQQVAGPGDLQGQVRCQDLRRRRIRHLPERARHGDRPADKDCRLGLPARGSRRGGRLRRSNWQGLRAGHRQGWAAARTGLPDQPRDQNA